MRIDRCVCHKAEFRAIREWAAAQDAPTFPEAQRRFGCGTGCGLCAPYVRRMLRTGQVVFHEIVTERDEPPTSG